MTVAQSPGKKQATDASHTRGERATEGVSAKVGMTEVTVEWFSTSYKLPTSPWFSTPLTDRGCFSSEPYLGSDD